MICEDCVKCGKVAHDGETFDVECKTQGAFKVADCYEDSYDCSEYVKKEVAKTGTLILRTGNIIKILKNNGEDGDFTYYTLDNGTAKVRTSEIEAEIW